MPVIRRFMFFAVVVLTSLGLLLLMYRVLAPGGWTPVKLAIMACFALTAPWTGICLGNALPGFVVLMLARDPARAVLPVDFDDDAPITAFVALAVTIRNEDMALVLPPLRRLLAGLDDRFVLAVLSDTQDAVLAAAESEAIAAWRLADPRVTYRRRRDNTGFKAGNVMDYLDHHAGGAELVVMLDADSEMSAAAVLRLVRIMQADPLLGIVQQLTVGRPADAAFPRLFQFGMRAGMRVWATGQGWWQGPDGPYWGHNAILRAEAFRAHCRLAPLPDGSAILSHDQVEAARMRAAGFKVCVWASEDGSMEANPPALPEFLHRDARWLAGNLQYRHLLTMPGFRAMGRWQLVQAILMFVGAPLYTAMLVLAAINVAAGDGAATPDGALWALVAAWGLALYAPKLLGYADILLDGQKAARYGGRALFAAGAMLECTFSLLLDAISQPHKTLAMLRLALGMRAGWLPQNRSARGVSWGEASRMFWPHTALGVGVFGLLAMGPGAPVLWALPFAGGLLVAIPLCVASASPRVSGWLRQRGVASTPEERGRLRLRQEAVKLHSA
jgi:membrane glycosyltransferase